MDISQFDKYGTGPLREKALADYLESLDGEDNGTPGATPTFQQVLTAGKTLTETNLINVNGKSLTFDDAEYMRFTTSEVTVDIYPNSFQIGVGTPTQNRKIVFTKTDITFVSTDAGVGNGFANTDGKVLSTDANGHLGLVDAGAGGGVIKSVDIKITNQQIHDLILVEGVLAENKMTLTGQPTVGSQIVLAFGETLSFVSGTPGNGFEIQIGATLDETKQNISATANSSFYSFGTFIGNDCVITSKSIGIDNTVFTTTEPNISFNGPMGTTTQGSDVEYGDPIIVLPVKANTAYGYPTRSCVWAVIDIKEDGQYIDETGATQFRFFFVNGNFTAKYNIDPAFGEDGNLSNYDVGVTRELNAEILQGDNGFDADDQDLGVAIGITGYKRYGGGDPDNTISIRVFYAELPSLPFG